MFLDPVATDCLPAMVSDDVCAQVVVLCKQHKLYNAFIYVYTHGLHDYITPLLTFQQSMKSGEAPEGWPVGGDADATPGYSVMLYVS